MKAIEDNVAMRKELAQKKIREYESKQKELSNKRKNIYAVIGAVISSAAGAAAGITTGTMRCSMT